MIFPSDCVDGSIEDNIIWYMKVAAWSEEDRQELKHKVYKVFITRAQALFHLPPPTSS